MLCIDFSFVIMNWRTNRVLNLSNACHHISSYHSSRHPESIYIELNNSQRWIFPSSKFNSKFPTGRQQTNGVCMCLYISVQNYCMVVALTDCWHSCIFCMSHTFNTNRFVIVSFVLSHTFSIGFSMSTFALTPPPTNYCFRFQVKITVNASSLHTYSISTYWIHSPSCVCIDCWTTSFQ